MQREPDADSVHESAAEPHHGVSAGAGGKARTDCILLFSTLWAARPFFFTPRKRMHILAKRFSERRGARHGAGS